MDKDKRPWTEIAEYASLAGSALGTLVAPVEPSLTTLVRLLQISFRLG
jgi:hypothetical protein